MGFQFSMYNGVKYLKLYAVFMSYYFFLWVNVTLVFGEEQVCIEWAFWDLEIERLDRTEINNKTALKNILRGQLCWMQQ